MSAKLLVPIVPFQCLPENTSQGGQLDTVFFDQDGLDLLFNNLNCLFFILLGKNYFAPFRSIHIGHSNPHCEAAGCASTTIKGEPLNTFKKADQTF